MNNDFWQWIAQYPEDTTMYNAYHRKRNTYWTKGKMLLELVLDFLLLFSVVGLIASAFVLFGA
jgi:hypothetical protein